MVFLRNYFLSLPIFLLIIFVLESNAAPVQRPAASMKPQAVEAQLKLVEDSAVAKEGVKVPKSLPWCELRTVVPKDLRWLIPAERLVADVEIEGTEGVSNIDLISKDGVALSNIETGRSAFIKWEKASQILKRPKNVPDPNKAHPT